MDEFSWLICMHIYLNQIDTVIHLFGWLRNLSFNTNNHWATNPTIDWYSQFILLPGDMPSMCTLWNVIFFIIFRRMNVLLFKIIIVNACIINTPSSGYSRKLFDRILLVFEILYTSFIAVKIFLTWIAWIPNSWHIKHVQNL